jgi:hypothetical protein
VTIAAGELPKQALDQLHDRRDLRSDRGHRRGSKRDDCRSHLRTLKDELHDCIMFADRVKWKTYSELSEDDRREWTSCDMLLQSLNGKDGK